MNSTELTDLKINLDDTEILNDLRVMVPRYSYDLTWEETGGVYHVTNVNYHDLIHTEIESDSIHKYGRRSKVNKYQVMDDSFKEAWAENQKQRSHEPLYDCDAVMVGQNAINYLGTKVSDNVTLADSITGINNSYWVDSYVIEARPGRLTLKLGLKENTATQQLSLFVIDTDLIDGEHIIA